MTAWLDFLINSDDPTDKALLDEHRARSWAFVQTMQWIVECEGIEIQTFDAIQRENDLTDELQRRITVRGAELADAGAEPASVEQIEAWNAALVLLISNLQDKGALKHWA